MATEKISAPYWNPDLPLEDRVNDLLARLTLEEKIGLMPQYQAAVERLGIQPYKHGTEAAHGMAWLGEATTYPQPIGLACTWDKELLRRIGSAIGDEARGFYTRDPEHNGLTLWAPTVDMERDPRWGRTEEAYGEDPVLAGKLTAALTQGIQGDHPFYLKAVATLKHFIGNNNEAGRGDTSVSLDPRNLREYYLKAFEIPFKEGGAQSMMTSYNAINGVPANLSRDVIDIVKREWGMNGFVVSDAFDVTGTVRDHHYVGTLQEAVARSVREGGIDSITDEAAVVTDAIRTALTEGLLNENDLDIALRNTFRVRFRLGEFDPAERNPYAVLDETAILKPEHAELAREAVQKAVVLLKNEGSMLPLQADKLGKLAVIGPLADIVYSDWYSGTMPYAVTPLEGIRKVLESAGNGGETVFARGNDRVRLKAAGSGKYVRLGDDDKATLAASAEAAADGDVFEMADWGWDSHTLIAERNGRYLTTDDKTIHASAKRIWEWFTKEELKVRRDPSDTRLAALATWNGTPVTLNEQGTLLAGDGLAAETANDINVGGSAEIGQAAQQKPAERFELECVTSGIEAAVEAARGADAAVVFVGNHPLINGKETMDRPDITLPASQEQLVLKVLEANPNTIVVVVGSYPFAINTLQDKVPAILYTSHAGQELGRGVADVLFGDYNPSGRLNMTWYQSVDQLPPFMDYDIIQGGRTYQYFTGEALYPFGHGLSYSDFRYEALRLSARRVKAGSDDAVEITCRVTNTSGRYGEEVVQLYVRAEASRVKRPRLQLADFQRTALAPGESAEVSFRLPLDALAFWDVTRGRFCIESGDYSLLLGSSSGKLLLEGRLTVDGETIPPRDLSQLTRAADYDASEGIHLGECRESGSAANVSGATGWLAFRDAELGGSVFAAELRAASTEAAVAEVRLDSWDGPLAGSCSIPAGGPQDWSSFTFALSGATGRRDVYLVLQGAAAISWFRVLD
ncbi:glycoside hydrolase family 3 C-terminal domain-containing protein [Paenibacillus sp. MMS20-IR301]|uniref:glycoside hydrolase family 3 C-terminal domain-containing protein n=1 Tax=Paenibacillus sp. MMS20-IR301 TaxID=2895946 RepID=UPI0028EF37D5|nr:glycoside hydrolase family 3 C-terminal domain-containing protein [Paenibacillus sp. MMS20-IR301]WNS46042.1 glycoside hydrolase family 3 C-terminal domain-containing protein [Paenibacillus sp. MMS20-IR301]